MRLLVLSLAAAFAVATFFPLDRAGAQSRLPDDLQTEERAVRAPLPDDLPDEEAAYGKASVLDRLFVSLKESDSESSARPIERAIQSIWIRGETDTANLMVRWGMRAMNAEEMDKAVRFFTTAIEHEPDFMEAWNKRATAYFVMKDYARSLEDIRVVLAMEPRHYGALAGLGIIMRQLGNEEAALNAFRAALAVNPHLSMPARAIKELEPQVEGRGI
ncbi:MAG: tetratricopeptide repeat protein [Pseudomonadota bacterium]